MGVCFLLAFLIAVSRALNPGSVVLDAHIIAAVLLHILAAELRRDPVRLQCQVRT